MGLRQSWCLWPSDVVTRYPHVQCTCTCTCSVLVEVAKYLVTFFCAGQWLYDSPLDYLQLWLNVSV